MKHLALLALLPLSGALTSCALPAKIIQTPVRLLQAGVRTVTDVDDTTTPATRDMTEVHGVAVKVVQPAAERVAE